MHKKRAKDIYNIKEHFHFSPASSSKTPIIISKAVYTVKLISYLHSYIFTFSTVHWQESGDTIRITIQGFAIRYIAIHCDTVSKAIYWDFLS